MISQRAKKEFLNRALETFDWIKDVNIQTLDKELNCLLPPSHFHTPPYKYQKACFLLGVSLPHFLYLLDLGLGKTKIVLDILKYRIGNGDCNKVLVLVPNKANIDGWLTEIEKHRPDLKAVGLFGHRNERRKLILSDVDLYIINYAGIVALTTELGQVGGRTNRKRLINVHDLKELQEKFDAIVFDESSFLKNSRTLTYKICNILSNGCSVRYALTGTPFGRSQPLDSKILTPKGWKVMKDIKVGDEVFGSNGKVTYISGITPQGINKIYEINFSDGSKVQCSEDHLWTVYKRYQRERQSRLNYRKDPYVLSLREILNNYVVIKISKKGRKIRSRNYTVPVPHPIQFPKKEVPLDAYVLGCLLGDGTFAGHTVCFASIDLPIIKELRLLLPECVLLPSKSYDKYQNRGWNIRKKKYRKDPHVENFVTSKLRLLELQGKVGEEKFVPQDYLFNDMSVRLGVLQGLMDTDGSVTNDGVASFSNISKNLIYAVKFLFDSLGGTGKILGPYYRSEKDRGHYKPIYYVHGQLPNYLDPFRLKRKNELVNKNRKQNDLYKAIDKIEFVGRKKTQCITVDSDDGLYITNGFTLTHNCPMDLWTQFHAIDKGETLGETLSIFRECFFDLHINYWGGYEYKLKKDKQELLSQVIKNRSIRYRPEECPGLPKKVYKEILVDFPDVAKEYYNNAVKEVVENIKGGSKSYRLLDNIFMRMRQISSGFVVVKTDEGERREIDLPENPKLEALIELLQEIPTDRKVIIFHEFIKSGYAIEAACNKLNLHNRKLWSGTKDHRSVLGDFLNKKDVNVLICNSKSGAYGLNLQVANYCIFFESPVSPIVRKQAEKRCHRPGQKYTVFYYDILMKNSIDFKIKEYLQEGKDLFKTLIEQDWVPEYV